MKFSRLNNRVGWIVGAIACTVYVMTMEATGSFWDCGEFVSSAYKLQIPHPPGAPLFVMLGRFFIILFGDSPHTAARAVNFMSAIASGLAILFLFWSITHFARKIIQRNNSQDSLTNPQLFTIMSAGVIGALAYTFCDSYWYSAVEGEVYATSAFFTALVFWAILKWEDNADKPGADKWIIFLFYMMGLSIGVHLLNLLTIPAVVMVFYFKRYKTTLWGTALAFLIGCVITGFVQKVVIQYTINGAADFDIYFVNSLNMPFFVGFAFFFALLIALFTIGIRWATRKKYYYLKLGLWSGAFMLLGYSTYFTTMIRSNADPAVDMFNVDNPVSLVGYLGRDQYGDWPLLYGPDFQDSPPRKDGGNIYTKGKEKYSGKDRYLVSGKVSLEEWDSTNSSHIFPRMWDGGNDRGQVDCYKQFAGLGDGDIPTMRDNIKYFVTYQNYWMYLRYFLWNYAGKQNDLEGFGNIRDGNWISGIPFLDNLIYGDQSMLPDSIHKNNKSYNRLFMLPLFLGLFGLFFQFYRNRKDFLITGLLFFFTGFAIVVYLNQAGYQPRERDYAYAGSCYAFAIWIGLGSIWIQELFQKFMKMPMAAYASAGLCFLAVPVIMGTQEWDDHDRSQKTLARDMGRDYLESCPQNALLISFGDNDTYPLWYAQEVEGIRPDVRVMNYSLLGTDWYINELRYKVNQNSPFDVIYTPEQIMGNRRDVVGIGGVPGFDRNKYYDLYTVLKDVTGSDDSMYTQTSDHGELINYLPVRKLSVPVDLQTVRANGTVNPDDSVVSELHLDLAQGKNYLVKNELAILAVIAANKWQRPICFNSTYELEDLGLAKYIRQDGLAGRLVPVESKNPNYNYNNDLAYHIMMTQFAYGNASTPGVYYDEENRRHLNTLMAAHAQLALSLINAGRKDSARNILEHFDQNVSQSNFPYGMTSNRGNQHNRNAMSFLLACYQSGDPTLAKKVDASLRIDLEQQMRYYNSLGEQMPDEQLAMNADEIIRQKGGNLSDKQIQFTQDILSTYQILMNMNDWQKQYAATKPAGADTGPLKDK